MDGRTCCGDPVSLHLLYGKRGGVYRIFFTIQEESVSILYVRHSARDGLEPED